MRPRQAGRIPARHLSVDANDLGAGAGRSPGDPDCNIATAMAPAAGFPVDGGPAQEAEPRPAPEFRPYDGPERWPQAAHGPRPGRPDG